MFVFTGYLDESGTHTESPLTVMGGVLGRAEQWERFEKEFSRLQADYGFRVWHTKNFKQKAGDFKGWTDEKCHDLYWALQKAAGDDLTEAVAVTLDNTSYDASNLGSPVRPSFAKGDALDDVYRGCMAEKGYVGVSMR